MKRDETIKPDEPINTVVELLDILKVIPQPRDCRGKSARHLWQQDQGAEDHPYRSEQGTRLTSPPYCVGKTGREVEGQSNKSQQQPEHTTLTPDCVGVPRLSECANDKHECGYYRPYLHGYEIQY